MGAAGVEMRLIGALALLLGAGAAWASTPDQWRKDIDALVADVRGTHPDPFVKTGELSFLREAEALKQAVPSLTEEQRMVRAMQLVARIGDGHSQLEPTGSTFALWYPFRLYEFSDGYFVTGAHVSAKELAGAQLLEVAGRPVAEVAAIARTLMGHDNRFDARQRLYPIHNAGLMRGLGYAAADHSLPVKLKLRSGKVVHRALPAIKGESSGFEWSFRPEYWGAVGPPEQWVSAFRGQTVAQLRELDTSRPLHLMYRRAFFNRWLPETKTYYIQSNVVGGTADESLPAFFRRALAEVERVKPDHLIVDIRHNFGGDGSNVTPVIHQFIARKFDPPWKNLYLVTGPKTFSAAIAMTDAFLDHMRPTVIGEPAGAPLNHYGDTNGFTYPDTGMRLAVSFERHQLGKSTDVSEIIPVDYPARFSFVEYAAGRDPAVDPVLAGKDVRSIPAIAATDGAAAALAAFHDRKARFASDESWRPTSEIDLRTIMRELDDQGRRDAAIEVARLNTQINPQEWRTWMNLGDLLLRSGRKAEAIENYRRSVALNDPTNFNTDRLDKAIADFEAGK